VRRQTRRHPERRHQKHKNTERRAAQKKRRLRNAQKRRTGCEGRISLLKRRHGINRCRYRGSAGMKSWVGLGVIADHLIDMARAVSASAVRAA
jgi:transposase, IS5 family